MATTGGYPEILLVMGDVRDARLIRECLLEAAPDALRLVHAITLQQAIERLGRGGLGAVLIDLGMPGSSEIEAIERLDLSRLGIPFIVLSDQDDHRVRERVSELGAQDFVLKNAIDGARLLEALEYAMVPMSRGQARGTEHATQLDISPPPSRTARSCLVDSTLRELCETMARDLGDETSFRFKARAGNVTISRPDHLRDLIGNLVLGIIHRSRAEGASMLAFDLKTYRCGSRVTVALHVDGCRPDLGTSLLEPFLQGQTDSPTPERLAVAASRLRELDGNIRFGNRPGVGPWIEIMVPTAAQRSDGQRTLAQ